MKNTSFIWNINNKLLDKFKKLKYYKTFLSDTFFNDCWMLKCGPNGMSERSKGKLSLYLILMRLPFKIKSIKIRYELIAMCDVDKIYKKTSETVMSTDMDGISSVGGILFKSSLLQSISTLSFRIKINIKNIKRH